MLGCKSRRVKKKTTSQHKLRCFAWLEWKKQDIAKRTEYFLQASARENKKKEKLAERRRAANG
eukprot:9743648-Prorocentrum_lima.AAC.1